MEKNKDMIGVQYELYQIEAQLHLVSVSIYDIGSGDSNLDTPTGLLAASAVINDVIRKLKRVLSSGSLEKIEIPT